MCGIELTPENAFDTLPRLAQTRAAIDEVLRPYPAAVVIVRQAINDDVAVGVPVTAGSLVLIASWILPRHRRFWVAPQRFDSSRFLPGAPQPARFAYMPFGAGPRVCVGASFAMTQMLIVVASLARRFRFRLASHHPVRPVGHISLHPHGGLQVTVERRAVVSAEQHQPALRQY